MIKSKLCVFAFAIATVFATNARPADYWCNAPIDEDTGLHTTCLARIWENGELQSRWLEHGSTVATEAGWVVNTANGWTRIEAD